MVELNVNGFKPNWPFSFGTSSRLLIPESPDSPDSADAPDAPLSPDSSDSPLSPDALVSSLFSFSFTSVR